MRLLISALLPVLCLGACATVPDDPAARAPVPQVAPAPAPPTPGPTLPPTPVPVAPPAAPPTAAAPVPPPPTAAEVRARVERLLPVRIPERAGWAADISAAFVALRLPPSTENLCAAMATIEQESSWQSDPVVPGLSAMAWNALYAKAARYHVPALAVDMAMLKTSPDGRSYKARLDALRTERQMNALFEDMVSELPEAARALGGRNPIRTGGPMQVSIAFAEQLVRERPYPHPLRGSVRHEVFTRRGGVYFGIAMLLDYPAGYRAMRHRFADYNAGRYSSRNAAFQLAVARLTGQPLVPDGDLLAWDGEVALAAPSQTQRALGRVAGSLGLAPVAIRRDLEREKTAGFATTLTWQRVFSAAEGRAGIPLPREAMPQIDLKSPKIRRKLTTAWFAGRVDTRWRACLARAPETP